MIHLFSCRWGGEVYMVAIEGDKDEAERILSGWFNAVEYVKYAKNVWDGNRHVGNCIIRGCWFAYLFGTKHGKTSF